MRTVSIRRADRYGPVPLSGFRSVVEIRARLLQAVRAWFRDHGFLEVDTPVRVRTPALERHIDAIPSGSAFLRTSPELHMKRLLAAGYERIFQVGPCFRAGEEGAYHHTEFTMLEWYRAGGGYLDVLADAKALVRYAVTALQGQAVFPCRGRLVDVGVAWESRKVSEVFLEYAGWDPVSDYDADRFTVDLLEKVEPRLRRDRPVVLMDYPVRTAALARCRAGNPPVAERWELYMGGLELANAFGELTDAAEQRRRFEQWADERNAAGRPVYALDERFLEALEQGMPASGGVALGIDRLVMLLADKTRINEVRPFPD